MIPWKKFRLYFKEYVGSQKWIKTMLMPIVIALIISNYLEIQCTLQAANLTSEKDSPKDTFYLLKLYVFYFLMHNTLRYIVNIFNSYFIANSIRNAFKNFFYEYFTISFPEFQKIGIGEAHYNIVRRANALSDFLTVTTMTFASNSFFLILVAHNLYFQVPMFMKIKISIAVFLFLSVSLAIQLYRTTLRKKVNIGLQSNSRKLYDCLLNYERIVTYDNIDIECYKYNDSMKYQVKYGIYYWVSFELVGFMNNIFFLLLNVYLINKFNTLDDMNTDKLKTFILLISQLREKVFDISKDLDDICSSFTNLDQSLIENSPKDIQSPIGMNLTRFTTAIEATDLELKMGNLQISNRINCYIPKGSKIAITGVNGAGKSTFMKALLGFNEYDGVLKIDGYHLHTIYKGSLRQLIAYIPQNTCLFDTTLMENLLIGNPGMSAEKVIEYCKMYEVHDQFADVGYDKPIGDRGKNLSGGQRQKLSFMRGVLRNSPIMIFDEATANMDSKSESSLIDLVFKNNSNKTVFMVIHNLDLLQKFDKIIFFAETTIQANDNFEDLYKNNKDFRSFYNEALRYNG